MVPCGKNRNFLNRLNRFYYLSFAPLFSIVTIIRAIGFYADGVCILRC